MRPAVGDWNGHQAHTLDEDRFISVAITAKRPARVNTEAQLLDQLKGLAVVAMFSDDDLLDAIVLKGGNAIALVYQLASGESIDLDFSMQGDFSWRRRRARGAHRTCAGVHLRRGRLRDLRLSVRRKARSRVGGHRRVVGWLRRRIQDRLARRLCAAQAEVEVLRKTALSIGKGKKFLIDISRFEVTRDKREVELDGLHHVCLFTGP